ncbi:MAG: hypothetical protein AAF770_01375 [Bacteroidota bacterium]
MIQEKENKITQLKAAKNQPGVVKSVWKYITIGTIPVVLFSCVMVVYLVMAGKDQSFVN